jgi:tRNA(Ile)-lysidine synthase TilS/MesJ
MLNGLKALQRFYPKHFELIAISVNPGFEFFDTEILQKNCDEIGVPLIIENSDIKEIVFDVRKEKNPCSLCANLRRGIINSVAIREGCNKIALGHHYDDVIETTLMNLLNNGTVETMLPKLHSQNFEGMELIRPLYLIREKDIIAWSQYNGLEFIRCACKFTDSIEKEKEIESGSKRYDTKKLIQNLLEYNENVEKNIYKATMNVNLNKILGYKKDGKVISYLDNYDNIKE